LRKRRNYRIFREGVQIHHIDARAGEVRKRTGGNAMPIINGIGFPKGPSVFGKCIYGKRGGKGWDNYRKEDRGNLLF